MSARPSILFVIPPGLGDMVSHHEATSGMGALVPGPRPFLYPPHTVAACAGVTRRAGLTTAVLDAVGRQLSVSATLNEIALAAIAAADSTVLAVLVSQGTAYADENFLRLLRHARTRVSPRNPASAPVLLFGPSAHFEAEAWLSQGLADAALLGEPEGAIAEAVAGLVAGEITGAVSARALCPQRYGADNLLLDLDALPFPAWDLLPWQPYGAVSLLSSRGCPAGCAYCAYTVAQGQRFRSQSPKRTVDELAWLAETIRPPRIQVRDPVFAHDRARVVAICERLLAQRITPNFACESRPEQFDDELLRLLRAAGCSMVKIGLESGDPALLQTLGRAADAAEAAQAIAHTRRVARTCRALGIKCQVFVMLGLPGQDAASLRHTAAALRDLPRETIIRATAYQAHPAVGLHAATAAVPAETLAWLEQANQPHPALLRRLYRRLKPSKSDPGSGSFSSRALPRSGSLAPLPPLSLAGQRAFITGGNGFLGGHVARQLVAAGAEVVALVREGSPLAALAELPVEIIRGDLQSPAGWQQALRGCDLCFHVAALFESAEQATAMYRVNVRGTSALLAACAAAGVRRVIHTSTIGTVGRPTDPDVLPDETVPFNLWQTASDYVKSKYLGELAVESWAVHGIEIVIVKPTAPVGAGDARPSATGRRILATLAGQVTPYPPAGINHVPVRDVALGHLLAAQHGAAGETYILGHREGNLDQRAFLNLVAEVAGVRPLAPVADQKSQSPLLAGLTTNPARAIRELGMPQSDLRAAFAEAVAWYRDAGAQG